MKKPVKNYLDSLPISGKKMLKKDLVALTPPMGFNSYDCYATTANEKNILDNANYMAKNLLPFGYQYIVLDIQWSAKNSGSDPNKVYNDFEDLTLDEYGRELPSIKKFPSSKGNQGFKPLADKIHALGLQFGIHILRGIPRIACYLKLPVYGTNLTADQIADPFSVSLWNADMYGLKNIRESQAYYDSIFKLYASWGVDFVKVDDIASNGLHPEDPYFTRYEVEMIRNAIDKSGKDMVLSLSPGPTLIENAGHLEKYANMWRISNDFWDKWSDIKSMFSYCHTWEKEVSPGNYPDCDMLPVGKLCIGFKENGKSKETTTRLSKDEQITMLTLWCIFNSPLMIGSDLPSLDSWTYKLLTNRDVLYLLGNTFDMREISHTEKEIIWSSKDKNNSNQYLALFNISEEERVFNFQLTKLGISKADTYDCWSHIELDKSTMEIKARIKKHGAILLRLFNIK